MIEFVERYRPFAEFLTENGFMVVGHDHLGHGDSVASKDDWGYFAENPRQARSAHHRLRDLQAAQCGAGPLPHRADRGRLSGFVDTVSIPATFYT